MSSIRPQSAADGSLSGRPLADSAIVAQSTRPNGVGTTQTVIGDHQSPLPASPTLSGAGCSSFATPLKHKADLSSRSSNSEPQQSQAEANNNSNNCKENTEPPPKSTVESGGGDKRRGRLGAVRSLDSNGSQDGSVKKSVCYIGANHRDKRPQTNTTNSNCKQSQTTTPTTSGNQQQRAPMQMFSLKQLALNSRNLAAKKRAPIGQKGGAGAGGGGTRASVVAATGSTLGRLLEFSPSSSGGNRQAEQSNSSSENSSSSAETSTTGATVTKQASRRRRSDGRLSAERAERNTRRLSDGYAFIGEQPEVSSCGDNHSARRQNNQSQLDGKELVADDDASDEDNNRNIEEEGETGDDDEDEEEDEDEEVDYDEEESASGDRLRRNCCVCEPVVSRIDFDGLPVTDVDLASYKDLCQLEQARHMRTHRRRQQLLDPSSAGSTLGLPGGGLHAQVSSASSLRRSSLQEESGAYYQLCTSGEEQLIRQRYVWYPPSLKQLTLVDEFFAQYPKEKIPFASLAAIQQPPSSGGQQTNAGGGVAGRVTQHTGASDSGGKSAAASCGNGAVVSSSGAQVAAVPSLAGSYRDEQISFQLPRQDISLDYCSYPMDEPSRQAYSQFIEKRNSQALDVGYVVQVNLTASTSFQLGADGLPATTAAAASSRQRAERKASIISQTSGIIVSTTAGAAGLARSQQLQRCRRCLVRFEDKQLAVVAPNFTIGSTALYRPLNTTCSSHPAAKGAPLIPTSSDCVGPLSAPARELASRLEQPPTANAAHFHPTCFTCSTCKELLVDLVYCLRDNKLYCLRHYGESLRPRCSWCQELIFSDEYLKAMNESFHVDHFLCRHCDSNLAGQRYVLKEEKPFCIQCYESNFANTCEDCQKPIGIDSRDLSYKNRHWHDTCFLCNKCQQSLIDKPFGSKADKVYCADCYDVAFAARCDGCKNPFRAGIKCYEDKYATRCTKCKQVIVSGGVTFRNEPWHRDCFNCCNCNKSLAGQRFTTRDVANETVKNTNKTNQPHNAYCIDCYGELFAKKCYACTQAITGLGGTRFVTFEDRSWHNDCFICNDCQTSLVGKGFITDGPETILCGECARAKLR